eukprot:TRINITY_DN724_c0_g1_i2.p1 TRINITY_DN724_c0_g1~~TRINITY_DN724_c0_g1_i2.p1  ORF type:complete len:261 (-),score=29.77 TRINITY_DN724_c0_g1_i2:90-872(-)
MRYSTGSQQQIVTAIEEEDSIKNIWKIIQAFGIRRRYEAYVKCGDLVRLEHYYTVKYLHSHHYRAPISLQGEVTGFGQDGVGDTGDNWQIYCDNLGFGSALTPQAVVTIQHEETAHFLYSGKTYIFDELTCGVNCPITGHLEVSTVPSRVLAHTKWRIRPLSERELQGVRAYEEDHPEDYEILAPQEPNTSHTDENEGIYSSDVDSTVLYLPSPEEDNEYGEMDEEEGEIIVSDDDLMETAYLQQRRIGHEGGQRDELQI